MSLELVTVLGCTVHETEDWGHTNIHTKGNLDTSLRKWVAFHIIVNADFHNRWLFFRCGFLCGLVLPLRVGILLRRTLQKGCAMFPCSEALEGMRRLSRVTNHTWRYSARAACLMRESIALIITFSLMAVFSVVEREPPPGDLRRWDLGLCRHAAYTPSWETSLQVYCWSWLGEWFGLLAIVHQMGRKLD